MMSDDDSLRYSNREVFGFVMGKTDIVQPVHPYQPQWMAHWAQASSGSSSQSDKHCTVTNVIKDHRGHCYSPVETMQPGYACKRSNDRDCDRGKQDPTSCMLQSVEARGSDHGRFMIIKNSVFKKNLSHSGSKTLGRLSKHKQPASSASWENITSYHLQNSDSPTSDWTHFPIFDINRKRGTIVAPKKRSSLNMVEAEMNKQLLPLSDSLLAPHMIEFASEMHERQQQNITQTNEEMRPLEFVEGSPHYKCCSSDMTSSMQYDEENDLFCSGLAFKEYFANANLTYLKHELCRGSKDSTTIVSEMKKDYLGCFGSSGTMLNDGSSSVPVCAPHPCLAEECGEKRGSSRGRKKTTTGLSKSNRISTCSPVSSRKGEPEKFSDATKHLSTTKEVGRDLYHKDQVYGGLRVSSKVKGTAFFEKLTLPATSHHHGQQGENLQNLVSSTNNMEAVDYIDTHFMKKENESLDKTDSMHIDLPEKPSSPEVGSFFALQKIPLDVVHPNMKNSDKTVTDTSGSESTDALSRKAPDPPPERTQGNSEPSCKWVKRLRPDPLDPIPIGTKRFKMGDAASSGEMQNLLTKVVNYNRSISDLSECQQLEKTTFFPKSGECLPGDSAKVTPWIRRWCRRSHETASPTPVLCEPENSKMLPEKFEAKQFPSLAAMALMGKQVTNFRPCEFRKKGSSIVWNL